MKSFNFLPLLETPFGDLTDYVSPFSSFSLLFTRDESLSVFYGFLLCETEREESLLSTETHTQGVA